VLPSVKEEQEEDPKDRLYSYEPLFPDLHYWMERERVKRKEAAASKHRPYGYKY